MLPQVCERRRVWSRRAALCQTCTAPPCRTGEAPIAHFCSALRCSAFPELWRAPIRSTCSLVNSNWLEELSRSASRQLVAWIVCHQSCARHPTQHRLVRKQATVPRHCLPLLACRPLWHPLPSHAQHNRDFGSHLTELQSWCIAAGNGGPHQPGGQPLQGTAGAGRGAAPKFEVDSYALTAHPLCWTARCLMPTAPALSPTGHLPLRRQAA